MENRKITESAFEEYLNAEYFINNRNNMGNNIFNCTNCGKKFKIKYDDNNIPISLWCETCKMTENKIKKQFKMKNSSINPKNAEDPYVSLAQMKVLLDRSERYWKNKNYPVGNGFNVCSDILEDFDKILSKAKIPSKYLIAESLD